MKNVVMKKVITERRTVSPMDVRQVCIDHDFYTCGTNDDYEAMLDLVGNNMADLSNEVLYEIADDIMRHSDPDKIDGMDVASMMFLIDNDACYHCFEVYEGRV